MRCYVNLQVFSPQFFINLHLNATPIGVPRKGSHVLLLNQVGKACKVDELGEFYVGGPSIAKGYYKSEIYSKEKFIGSPIPESSGTYYKTGDLAKRDKDGVYHYLGRTDNQIQIYGNRIEPAEIELVLTGSDLIKSAAILDFKDEKRHWTVAFVEKSDKDSPLEAKDIRNMVGQKLPSYMIPYEVEFLNKLPFNHTGKIDRKALRKKFKIIVRDDSIKAADTTIQVLKEIWQSVFKTEEIEINDDFFSLGGDSIMALEVLHHIRKSFQVSPKPVELFRKRTIYTLATHLDEINQEQILEVEKLPNHKEYKGDEFPLSVTQKGFYLVHSNTDNKSPNLIGTIPIVGLVDPLVFIKILEELVDCHAILRTGFYKEGLKTVQKVLSNTKPQIEVLDLSRKSKQERPDLIQKITEGFLEERFDLTKPPSYKMVLAKESDQLSTLILCIHHIVGDAWSLKILLDELLYIYHQHSLSGKLTLPKFKTSFRDVVNYEIAARSGSEFVHEEKFWKGIFSQSKKITLDSQWLANSDRDLEVNLHIPKLEKDRLQSLCIKNGLSLFQLIFTMYARALSKVLDESNLLICSSVSGRELPLQDINKIIGPFAKSLPVGIQLKNANFKSNYEQLNQTFLNAL